MNNFVIKRPRKQLREKVITIRLTPQEESSERELRGKLKFKHMVDFFLFCKHVVEQLYVWHQQGYEFFIKKKEEKDYQKVDIEFQPNKEPS